MLELVCVTLSYFIVFYSRQGHIFAVKIQQIMHCNKFSMYIRDV